MKLVPNYVHDAQETYALLHAAAKDGHWSGEHEYDVHTILVHATLAGAPYEDLIEIAQICAAVVFLPREQA